MAVKPTTGDCEFCDSKNAALYPQHGDMMCQSCIDRENAVVQSVQVIETSRQNDATIELKADIMHAATTSFIELQGAINSNPDIAEADRKSALVKEAIARIQKLDSVIFAHDAEGMSLKNERMVWLKTTQELVATLRADERAKYAKFNVNYQPAPVVLPGRAKSKTPTDGGATKRKISPSSKYTHKDVVEACSKYGADITMVKMMLLARAAKGLTPDAAAQEYAQKHSAKTN